MKRVYYTIQDWCEVPEDLGWLTAGERLRLDGFRFEKRRRDWLLGRWVAKLALLGAAGVPDQEIDRFEIASASDGAPLPLLDGRPYETGLSLSHSNDRAICAVSADIEELGCDIELIGPRSSSFVETFFTASECEWVENTDPQSRDSLITMIWSAKESALKALRHGLTVDTRSVEVSADGTIAAADWNAARILASDEGTLSGWWRVDGSSILSVVGRQSFAMPVALRPGTTVGAKQTPITARCEVLQS